jgi:hypothetical protein
VEIKLNCLRPRERLVSRWHAEGGRRSGQLLFEQGSEDKRERERELTGLVNNEWQWAGLINYNLTIMDCGCCTVDRDKTTEVGHETNRDEWLRKYPEKYSHFDCDSDSRSRFHVQSVRKLSCCLKAALLSAELWLRAKINWNLNFKFLRSRIQFISFMIQWWDVPSNLLFLLKYDHKQLKWKLSPKSLMINDP